MAKKKFSQTATNVAMWERMDNLSLVLEGQTKQIKKLVKRVSVLEGEIAALDRLVWDAATQAMTRHEEVHHSVPPVQSEEPANAQ